MSLRKAAKRGRRFVELPYAVKGMDVSFAGILRPARLIRPLTIFTRPLCYAVKGAAPRGRLPRRHPQAGALTRRSRANAAR